MGTINFNVNHWVSVRLTEAGLRLHRENFDRWTSAAGVTLEYSPPMQDAEGWSRWQMHHLMNEFGPHMGLCSPIPFHTDIRLHPEGSPQ